MAHANHTFQSGLKDSVSGIEDAGALSAIQDGLHHEVEDLIKLELTAEQMLKKEMVLVRDYVAWDVSLIWDDLRNGWLDWELTLGAFLLQVADPTQVEWQRNKWLSH